MRGTGDGNSDNLTNSKNGEAVVVQQRVPGGAERGTMYDSESRDGAADLEFMICRQVGYLG